MIVRSHLPWPLRWAVVALTLGFSGAIALWAFEFGKDIAGLDRNATEELSRLRGEVAQLREEREKALSIANTADSLLKAERAAQEKLAQQIRQAEAENLTLKNDLGFFERLLPAGDSVGVTIRGLQAETVTEGQLRYQLLVMQPGKAVPEIQGRYEMTLTGTLDGRPWALAQPGGPEVAAVEAVPASGGHRRIPRRRGGESRIGQDHRCTGRGAGDLQREDLAATQRHTSLERTPCSARRSSRRSAP